MHCSQIHRLLRGYLTGTLDPAVRTRTRQHLDDCSDCWNRWNLYRWEQANDHPLLAELRTYLGAAFQYGYDSSAALADEWDAAAPANPDDARAFFATSTGYLYNLTIWEASGNRPRYIDAALPALPHPMTILDYGCGIGIDTIALRDHGHTVIPAELPSPHADFARRRFAQRGQPDTIHDPVHLLLPGMQPDLLWIIDTFDHLSAPATTLGPLLHLIPTVITEDMTSSRNHGRQGFHHNRSYSEITRFFAQYGLHPQPLGNPPVLTHWTRASNKRADAPNR